jgi:hypothetical protein
MLNILMCYFHNFLIWSQLIPEMAITRSPQHATEDMQKEGKTRVTHLTPNELQHEL